MFNKKKIVVDHIFQAVQPIIAKIQITSDIPSLFWKDDYILGFVGSIMAFHLTKTSPVKLNETDYGEVMAQSFERLSFVNSLPITLKYFEFFKDPQKASDRFNEGKENALIIISVILKIPLGPDAQSRIHSISEDLDSVDYEYYHAVLMKRFFYDEVRTLC